MLFLSILNFFACDLTAGEMAMPACEEVESPVSANEETLLGFTPQEVVDAVPLSNTVGLEWEDGSIDCLHYTLQLDAASARDVDVSYAELDSDGPIASIHIECNDYVAIDGIVSVATPDGEINEEFSMTMVYTLDSMSGEVVSGFMAKTTSLSGTYVPSDSDSSSEYHFDGQMTDGLFSGSLVMQTSGTDGDIAWAENTYIAEWGLIDPPADCLDGNE